MAKSVFLLLAVITVQVSAELCPYYDIGGGNEYCVYGCCSTTYSPCCDDDYDIYSGAPFIAGITCGIVALIIAVIAGLLYRRRYVTTVQYAAPVAPGGPQIFTTSSTTNTGFAYGNPGYNNARIY